MLAIVQFVFAFLGSRGYAERKFPFTPKCPSGSLANLRMRVVYIFVTNVYVEIICSLLATLWVAQNRWSEDRIPQLPKTSRISRISFFKDHTQPTNITNVATMNTIGNQSSAEGSIGETNGDIDRHQSERFLKDDEKLGLNNRSGDKWELNVV